MAGARVLELLERLVGFEVLSGADNRAMTGFIADHLAALGFTLHRLPHPDGNREGLFAALGPEGPGGVMLSAHVDVVPVAGQNWTRPPFRLSTEGGRLYGRGTTDMKGYLACMLALAEQAASRPLREPLKLAISYDEEIGCQGMQRMIGALASGIGLPRLCLVGEPTQMGVAIGHKGKAALRARFTGRAGHSALAPEFLNALHLAADFVQALRAKGMGELGVFLHIVKNAAPTALAVMGLQLGYLLGGSILIETVFSWPGTGFLLNAAIFQRDLPLLQGTILVLALLFVKLNMIVDLLQSLLDPRIQRS